MTNLDRKAGRPATTGSTWNISASRPTFEKYVRDAFNPVGLMLDFWAESVPGGSSQTVNVVVINDLEPAWKGEVRLNVMKGEDRLSSRCVPCEVAGFGRQVVSLPLDAPRPGG